jgi:ABC-type phosphate transport system substrate-binding protein
LLKTRDGNAVRDCQREEEALRRSLLLVPIFILVVVVVAGASLPSTADEPFRVIVHPHVKGNQIPKGTLSSIFLKESTRWGDGSTVYPVDQSMRAAVREAFTTKVIGKPIEGVQAYWTRRFVEGRVWPPPVKQSDADVITYVASTPGAIGYVSSTTPLPDSVKSVSIVE